MTKNEKRLLTVWIVVAVLAIPFVWYKWDGVKQAFRDEAVRFEEVNDRVVQRIGDEFPPERLPEDVRVSQEVDKELAESVERLEGALEELGDTAEELTVELEGDFVLVDDDLFTSESNLLFVDDMTAWDYLIHLEGRDSDDWIGIKPNGEVEIHGFEDMSAASRAFWEELGRAWPGFVDGAIVARLDPDGDGLVEFKIDGESFTGELELLEAVP